MAARAVGTIGAVVREQQRRTKPEYSPDGRVGRGELSRQRRQNSPLEF